MRDLHIKTISTKDAAFALLFCFVLSGLAAVLRNLLYHAQHKLPPGPNGLPLLGSIFQVPTANAHLKFTEWANKYGSIISYSLLGHTVIVLNDHKSSIDLLEKRSAIYSDRPRTMVMASDLVGWGQGVTLRPTGPGHRRLRKMLSTALNPSAVQRLLHFQHQGVIKYIKSLSREPESFYSNIRASVGDALVRLTFGRESSESFPYFEMVDSVENSFSATALPFTWMVDIFPILRYIPEWVPGADFQRQARVWREELSRVVHWPYERVKSDIRNGNFTPSYISALLDAHNKPSEEEEGAIAWSAASLYTGGVDTTTIVIQLFILAMCLFPDVQRKAQLEIDNFTRGERFPTPSERDRLPYVDACLKEIFRWHPIGSLGQAHRATREDEYNGFYIPKGATIMSNTWALSRDISVYPNPNDFIPERWLPDAQGITHHRLDQLRPFGFGKRVCPGMYLAEVTTFMYCSHILAAFNIGKCRDSNGLEMEPSIKFAEGVLQSPQPFSCLIATRNPALIEGLEES